MSCAYSCGRMKVVKSPSMCGYGCCRGDSVLTGALKVVVPGSVPLCGTDDLAPITMHFGEVAGLPIGR